MTRDDLRTLVRSLSRTEAHDITDVEIDVYLNEGYNEVLINAAWPWCYATTPDTVTQVADTASYTLAAAVRKVLAVTFPSQGYSLKSVALSDWARLQNTVSGSTLPTHFAHNNGELNLWPTPSTTDDLEVYYYEHPAWGASGISEPVFDAPHHSVLSDWALSRLWEQEEDFQRSNDYRGRFELKLGRMRAFYNTETIDRPMIYGGAGASRGRSNMPFLADASML